tara:strand:- start:19519 stop:20190 length:672 start_codon:yes stop_codon:yes gene_type:complete
MTDIMPEGVVSEEVELTDKQRIFVDEYIIDFNSTRAAKAAGYSEDSAANIGSENVRKPYIAKAIDEAIADRRKRLRIDADTVLWKWWQIANADYNELSSVRRVACGYCYGGASMDEGGEPVIDPSKEPDVDCQFCKGEGSPFVYIADTSKLSPEAKMLYQGAKETKFGIEVMTADRMKALDNVARHLGMFKEQIEHSGSVHQEVSNLTPEQVIERMKQKQDEY